MLNKELFGGGGSSELDYTHIVKAGYQLVSDDFYVCGLSPSFEDSSINPPTLLDIYSIETPIVYLYSNVQTGFNSINLGTDGYFLADWQRLHLGRSDTREYFGTPSDGNEESGYASWILDDIASPLFSPEDNGKEIPIWLSYDPPPWL